MSVDGFVAMSVWPKGASTLAFEGMESKTLPFPPLPCLLIVFPLPPYNSQNKGQIPWHCQNGKTHSFFFFFFWLLV